MDRHWAPTSASPTSSFGPPSLLIKLFSPTLRPASAHLISTRAPSAFRSWDALAQPAGPRPTTRIFGLCGLLVSGGGGGAQSRKGVLAAVAAAQRIVPRQVMISLVSGSLVWFHSAIFCCAALAARCDRSDGSDCKGASQRCRKRRGLPLAFWPKLQLLVSYRPLALTLPISACVASTCMEAIARRVAEAKNERSTSMQQSSWSSSRWCSASYHWPTRKLDVLQ